MCRDAINRVCTNCVRCRDGACSVCGEINATDVCEEYWKLLIGGAVGANNYSPLQNMRNSLVVRCRDVACRVCTIHLWAIRRCTHRLYNFCGWGVETRFIASVQLIASVRFICGRLDGACTVSTIDAFCRCIHKKQPQKFSDFWGSLLYMNYFPTTNWLPAQRGSFARP